PTSKVIWALIASTGLTYNLNVRVFELTIKLQNTTKFNHARVRRPIKFPLIIYSLFKKSNGYGWLISAALRNRFHCVHQSMECRRLERCTTRGMLHTDELSTNTL